MSSRNSLNFICATSKLNLNTIYDIIQQNYTLYTLVCSKHSCVCVCVSSAVLEIYKFQVEYLSRIWERDKTMFRRTMIPGLYWMYLALKYSIMEGYCQCRPSRYILHSPFIHTSQGCLCREGKSVNSKSDFICGLSLINHRYL